MTNKEEEDIDLPQDVLESYYVINEPESAAAQVQSSLIAVGKDLPENVLDNLKEQVSRLTEDVNTVLKLKQEGTVVDIDTSLKEDLLELVSKVNSLATTQEETTSTVSAMDKELTETKQEVQSLRTEMQELRELKTTVKELTTNVANVTSKVDDVAGEVATMQHFENELLKLHQQMTELQSVVQSSKGGQPLEEGQPALTSDNGNSVLDYKDIEFILKKIMDYYISTKPKHPPQLTRRRSSSLSLSSSSRKRSYSSSDSDYVSQRTSVEPPVGEDVFPPLSPDPISPSSIPKEEEKFRLILSNFRKCLSDKV